MDNLIVQLVKNLKYVMICISTIFLDLGSGLTLLQIHTGIGTGSVPSAQTPIDT